MAAGLIYANEPGPTDSCAEEPANREARPAEITRRQLKTNKHNLYILTLY